MTIKEHSKTEPLNGHRYRRGNYRKTNNFDCTQFGWPKPYLVLDTPEDDFKPENYTSKWHCAICASNGKYEQTKSLSEIFRDLTGISEIIEMQQEASN